jgi:hypothetical protein
VRAFGLATVRRLACFVRPMPSYAHLDALIGQALECLNQAAAEIRDLPFEPATDNVRKIGEATYQLWELRQQLYREHPEAKRDFVVESELNEARFEHLSELLAEASAAETDGRREAAIALFSQLRSESQFGFFQRCAEAGLYRLSHVE